jgi:hypothetical protein
MLRLILPLVLALGGLAAGLAAGHFLKPEAVAAKDGDREAEADAAAGDDDAHADAALGKDDAHGQDDAKEPDPSANEFVKMNNQFVVPVVAGGRVDSLVILSLSLEVEPGTTDAVYAREPKLRDSFLQVLFDHANTGGFAGTYTDGTALQALRRALLEAARKVLGASVVDVLISDILRQDS